MSNDGDVSLYISSPCERTLYALHSVCLYVRLYSGRLALSASEFSFVITKSQQNMYFDDKTHVKCEVG